jgi:hypothetical protein
MTIMENAIFQLNKKIFPPVLIFAILTSAISATGGSSNTSFLEGNVLKYGGALKGSETTGNNNTGGNNTLQ